VMVAIDGCQVGCIKAILEHVQVPLKRYLVLTDEGIEKNKRLKLNRAEIDRVKAAIKTAVGGELGTSVAAAGKTSSCC